MIYIKQAPEVIATGTYDKYLYRFWHPFDQVLIIGCGRGTQSQLFLNAVNLDIDRDILMYCRTKGLHDLVQASASHLPFKQAFHNILMADIIEHFPPMPEFTMDVIKEVNRVSCSPAYVAVIMPLKDALNMPKSILNRIMHKPDPIWSLAGHTNPISKLDLVKAFHQHFSILDDSTPPAMACSMKLPGCLGGQYAYMMFRKI